MSKLPNVPWWSPAGLVPSEPDTDYADMGTAFGLDASLALPEDDADDASPGEERPVRFPR